LAHEEAAAFRNLYELIHRHRAEAPNALWQADYTPLDILIVDANGKRARNYRSLTGDELTFLLTRPWLARHQYRQNRFNRRAGGRDNRPGYRRQFPPSAPAVHADRADQED